jgi:hypothetical protein
MGRTVDRGGGRRERRRTRLAVGALAAAVTVVLGLGIASVLVIPTWLHPPLTDQQRTEAATPRGKDRLAAEDARRQRQNETRSMLLQATGVLLLLTSASVGAYLTGRQLHLSRQGQVTERFTRAVDQLGNDTLDVRLGGIYALERIAHDSSDDRDTIVEVLSAFIREHAPSNRDPGSTTGSAQPAQPLVRRTLTADVQAALTVLGRSSRPGIAIPDLRGANLEGADLMGADLGNAALRGAVLRNAILWGANLVGADLMEADLRRANLASAVLRAVVLEGADLRDADLQDADLRNAHLLGADLRGALLRATVLRNAYLGNADLRGVDLRGADLEGAVLWDADLEGALGIPDSHPGAQPAANAADSSPPHNVVADD